MQIHCMVGNVCNASFNYQLKCETLKKKKKLLGTVKSMYVKQQWQEEGYKMDIVFFIPLFIVFNVRVEAI